MTTLDTPAAAEPVVDATPEAAPVAEKAAPVATPAPKTEAKPAAKPAAKTPTKPAAKAEAKTAAPAKKSLIAAVEPEAPAAEQGDATGESADAAQKDPDASVVPDTYDLRGADGDPLDDESAANVSAVARKLGLTNEAAQAYVDHEIARTNAQWETWQNEIKNHPKLGGDNLQTSLKAAARAKALGSDRMQRLLDGPWGDNPAVFEYLTEIGNRVAPDRPPTTKPTERKAPATEQDELRELYPEDFKDQ